MQECTRAECILHEINVIDFSKRQMALTEEEEAISFRPGAREVHDMYPCYPMNGAYFPTAYGDLKEMWNHRQTVRCLVMKYRKWSQIVLQEFCRCRATKQQ